MWRGIKGFGDKYLIDEIGRVKSLAKHPGKFYGKTIEEKILKQCLVSGYYCVSITRDGKNILVRIHQAVWDAFGNKIRTPGSCVCHIDGNRLNNSISNIYLGDVVTNTLDKYRHGRTKLSIDQIHEIRLLGKSHKQSELANKYGVKQPYISRILSNKRCTII